MAYKSIYPHLYDEGVINMSVTVTRVAKDLLEDNDIGNYSAFINDLIVEALQEKEVFKKRIMKQINAQLRRLKEEYGEIYYIQQGEVN